MAPREPRGDPDGLDPPLPADLAAALSAEGVPLEHGWSRRRQQPWRMRWQRSGPDRVDVARRLESRLQGLGYDDEASFWP